MFLLEELQFEGRKTKPKVITQSYDTCQSQSREPIKARSKYL